MSTMEPDEDGLRALLDSLEEPAPGEVTDLTKLADQEIVKRYLRVKEELRQRGELIEPRDERGAELLSEHGALIVELHRRNLR